MKKIIFTLVIVCCVTVYAQAQFKPQAGAFTTELQFSPFSDEPFTEIGITGRFFLTEKLAFRANLDVGMNGFKLVEKDNNGDDVTYKENGSSFGLSLGAEYHLGNWERVSPYAGAKLGFSTNGTSASETRKNYSLEIINGGGGRNGQTTFNMDVVVGVDIYIISGLYMGAEYGIGFRSVTAKAGEVTETTGGSSTSTKYDAKTTGYGLNIMATPRIRLGWRF
jgi:hypothetical protein